MSPTPSVFLFFFSLISYCCVNIALYFKKTYHRLLTFITVWNSGLIINSMQARSNVQEDQVVLPKFCEWLSVIHQSTKTKRRKDSHAHIFICTNEQLHFYVNHNNSLIPANDFESNAPLKPWLSNAEKHICMDTHANKNWFSFGISNFFFPSSSKLKHKKKKKKGGCLKTDAAKKLAV